ncbi:hypothetical protein OIU76_017586 [Salix suchowensis]|nr:hypothetical protein OIU76_017586 [Salix suchowensis]
MNVQLSRWAKQQGTSQSSNITNAFAEKTARIRESKKRSREKKEKERRENEGKRWLSLINKTII